MLNPPEKTTLFILYNNNGRSYEVVIPTSTTSVFSPISCQLLLATPMAVMATTPSNTKEATRVPSRSYNLLVFRSCGCGLHHPPTTEPQFSGTACRRCWLFSGQLLYFSGSLCYLCAWPLVPHQTFC